MKICTSRSRDNIVELVQEMRGNYKHNISNNEYIIYNRFINKFPGAIINYKTNKDIVSGLLRKKDCIIIEYKSKHKI